MSPEQVRDLFREELAFFEEKKPELLRTNAGQFAVIKERRLLGCFTTYEQAYQAALDQLGDVTFLIKPILEQEPVEVIPLLARALMNAGL